jgi:hypothetical protein
MSRKKWLIIGAIGILICVCVIPLTLFFQPWLLRTFVPLYIFKSTPSQHAGYTQYTLTRGNTTYVSDYEEYSLSSPGNDHQIGQTASGMRLYEIYGQKKYIVVYSFMDQVAVFRDNRYPAVDLSTASITDMKLASLAYAPGLGPQKDTQDSKLIQDVIAILTTGTPATNSTAASNVQKYCLYLSGGDLIGMQYCVAAYVDSTGNVYLAHDTLSKDWFPVGELVADWVKTP